MTSREEVAAVKARAEAATPDLIKYLAARVEAAERERDAAYNAMAGQTRELQAASEQRATLVARIARLEEAVKGAVDLIADGNDFLAKLELEEALT